MHACPAPATRRVQAWAAARPRACCGAGDLVSGRAVRARTALPHRASGTGRHPPPHPRTARAHSPAAVRSADPAAPSRGLRPRAGGWRWWSGSSGRLPYLLGGPSPGPLQGYERPGAVAVFGWLDFHQVLDLEAVVAQQPDPLPIGQLELQRPLVDDVQGVQAEVVADQPVAGLPAGRRAERG